MWTIFLGIINQDSQYFRSSSSRGTIHACQKIPFGFWWLWLGLWWCDEERKQIIYFFKNIFFLATDWLPDAILLFNGKIWIGCYYTFLLLMMMMTDLSELSRLDLTTVFPGMMTIGKKKIFSYNFDGCHRLNWS